MTVGSLLSSPAGGKSKPFSPLTPSDLSKCVPLDFKLKRLLSIMSGTQIHLNELTLKFTSGFELKIKKKPALTLGE